MSDSDSLGLFGGRMRPVGGCSEVWHKANSLWGPWLACFYPLAQICWRIQFQFSSCPSLDFIQFFFDSPSRGLSQIYQGLWRCFEPAYDKPLQARKLNFRRIGRGWCGLGATYACEFNINTIWLTPQRPRPLWANFIPPSTFATSNRSNAPQSVISMSLSAVLIYVHFGSHWLKMYESVVPSSSTAASTVAALTGLDLTGLNVLVGLSCSPITVVGNNCGSTIVTYSAPGEQWATNDWLRKKKKPARTTPKSAEATAAIATSASAKPCSNEHTAAFKSTKGKWSPKPKKVVISEEFVQSSSEEEEEEEVQKKAPAGKKRVRREMKGWTGRRRSASRRVRRRRRRQGPPRPPRLGLRSARATTRMTRTSGAEHLPARPNLQPRLGCPEGFPRREDGMSRQAWHPSSPRPVERKPCNPAPRHRAAPASASDSGGLGDFNRHLPSKKKYMEIYFEPGAPVTLFGWFWMQGRSALREYKSSPGAGTVRPFWGRIPTFAGNGNEAWAASQLEAPLIVANLAVAELRHAVVTARRGTARRSHVARIPTLAGNRNQAGAAYQLEAALVVANLAVAEFGNTVVTTNKASGGYIELIQRRRRKSIRIVGGWIAGVTTFEIFVAVDDGAEQLAVEAGILFADSVWVPGTSMTRPYLQWVPTLRVCAWLAWSRIRLFE
ncbi:hypothetical protein C8J57DRAFT_1226218 [Mycena rebaudengoi]|nr:hypothetical protein C8J57DRAFT_1226218 [Mycena rebaudengoi]